MKVSGSAVVCSMIVSGMILVCGVVTSIMGGMASGCVWMIADGISEMVLVLGYSLTSVNSGNAIVKKFRAMS